MERVKQEQLKKIEELEKLQQENILKAQLIEKNLEDVDKAILIVRSGVARSAILFFLAPFFFFFFWVYYLLFLTKNISLFVHLIFIL